ncbi:MAG: ribonuclease HII [Acidimicrobiaceae bacterium]|nr:ribonuclease HII [Acidimicrobiaceae bacterium]
MVYETALLANGEVVVGIDEVGRGALAGPLVVGAVALSELRVPPGGLNDSKLLTSKQRDALVGPLEDWATEFALGWASAEEIDSWGIRVSLAVAATRAIDQMAVRPTHALIDGSFNLLRAPLDVPMGSASPPPFTYAELRSTIIVKGDQRSATIAAASVLAKVQRDRYMREIAIGYEDFGWAQNKGYGAAGHMEAIRRLGPCLHHRRSWKLPVSSDI